MFLSFSYGRWYGWTSRSTKWPSLRKSLGDRSCCLTLYRKVLWPIRGSDASYWHDHVYLQRRVGGSLLHVSVENRSVSQLFLPLSIYQPMSIITPRKKELHSEDKFCQRDLHESSYCQGIKITVTSSKERYLFTMQGYTISSAGPDSFVPDQVGIMLPSFPKCSLHSQGFNKMFSRDSLN